MNKTSDTDRLRDLSSNSHQAFEAIFMEYFPKVKYFITHLIKSEDVAEELSQEIFLKIWTNREKMLNVQSLNAYLYRMAKNASINHLEHRYVEDSYIQSYNIHGDATIEEELYAKETEFLIQLVVDQMPAQRRKVFELSRTEGLSNQEIANQLHVTKKTVENHLNIALKEIRKAISLMMLFF